MDVELRKAIHEHKVVEFMYEGELRVAEPYTYGKLKTTGNPALSAYFVGGFSRSKQGKGWRLYLTAEISDLKISEVIFLPNREGYTREDSRMGEIYAAA